MGALSKFNLQSLINENDISTLIETGTAYGAGVDYAMSFPFEKIYSIEYNENLAKDCKNKYAIDRRINIINNTSIDGLISIFETDKNLGNIIYWLDAHYPYEDYNLGDEELRLPLKEELKVIKKYRHQYKDIILIDDLRIYEVNDYESGNLPEWINRGEYTNIDFVYEMFQDTHTIEKDLSHQGYLILIPKN